MPRIPRKLALLIAVISASCAMSESDNRRLLNALDEHLAPESTAGKWALAPVALPTGLVAFAVDAAITVPD